MAHFDPPYLEAPHLADILSRRVLDVPVHLVRRRPVQVEVVDDPRAAARDALTGRLEALREGQSVAVAVGSRGISSIAEVVAGVVSALRERGAEPFVVPAMGSHGGATADGQQQTLAALGVSEEYVDAPVRATMQTRQLGRHEGVDVAVDANAVSADHVLLVNRLKSHTSFSGQIESGLAKMLAIGLGKQHGAEELHRLGPRHLESRIRSTARYLCERLPVLGGVALVEGPDKRLVAVELVEPPGIGGDREAELLALAKSYEARLPFGQLDVLVVDEMGKEFSGTGMDTNVIGRRMVRSMPEPEAPRVTNIVCLEVSPRSHGNATGIGLADFVPRRALEGIDPVATYANTLTAGSQGVQRGQIPITLADEVDAVSAAILTSDVVDPSRLRLARIRNTLHLDEMLVTAPLLEEASADYETADYETVEARTLFGEGGRLASW